MKRGIYFLIIADVQIDEEDFATKLIDKGYAVKTSRKKKAYNWCK